MHASAINQQYIKYMVDFFGMAYVHGLDFFVCLFYFCINRVFVSDGYLEAVFFFFLKAKGIPSCVVVM